MVVLVTHVFGYANKGDHALLESLVKSIRVTFPDAVIRGICRHPATQKNFFPDVQWFRSLGGSCRQGIARQVENTYSTLCGFVRHMVPSVARAVKWGVNSSPACYQGVDLVVACPGGYLEDSNHSIIPNLLELWFSIRSPAPVILAPQSIGPFRSRIWRWAASRILRRADYICVREDESRRIVLEDLGVPGHIVYSLPDMAFYDCDVSLASGEVARRSLGIADAEDYACGTMVDWYFPFHPNPHQKKLRYISEVAAVARQIRAVLGMRTVMLKQIDASPGIAGDDEILHQLKALSDGAVICASEAYPPAVMRAIIAGAKLFLGSRMHSNIFAVQSAVPTVAIGYLPKTQAIMAMLGLGEFVCDIAEMDRHSFFRLACRAMDSHEVFRMARDRLELLGQSGRNEFQALLARTRSEVK